MESNESFIPYVGVIKEMFDETPDVKSFRVVGLDGKKLFEEVTYPDSMGHIFHAFPDGTFLLGKDGREVLRGEVYEIRDGVLTQISREGDVIPVV